MAASSSEPTSTSLEIHISNLSGNVTITIRKHYSKNNVVGSEPSKRVVPGNLSDMVDYIRSFANLTTIDIFSYDEVKESKIADKIELVSELLWEVGYVSKLILRGEMSKYHFDMLTEAISAMPLVGITFGLKSRDRLDLSPLAEIKTLKRFWLSHDHVSEKFLRTIMTQVSILHLEYPMDQTQLKIMSKLLRDNLSTVEILEIDNPPILNDLGAALKTNTTLKSLMLLSKVYFPEPIFRGLVDNQSLLKLHCKLFGTKDILALNNMLSHNTMLESLTLSASPGLFDYGRNFEPLVVALANSKLTSLTLLDGTSTLFTTSLLKALVTNTTLTELACSSISSRLEVDAEVLVNLLSQNTTLTRLELHHFKVRRPELLSALNTNTTLTHVDPWSSPEILVEIATRNWTNKQRKGKSLLGMMM